MKNLSFLILFLTVIYLPCFAQLPDGPYFGQEAPGSEPVIFAPDLISLSGRKELKITFSPDGQECILGIVSAGSLKLLRTKAEGGHWTEPALITFDGITFEREPMITPGGNKLVFTAPQPNATEHWYTDIYVSDYSGGEWSSPVRLSGSANSGSEEWHPGFTYENKLYFCSNRSGKYYLYCAVPENGDYSRVEKLPAIINSVQDGAFDPYIAPDESYLIFTSGDNADQFISYRKEDGSWTNPKSLGTAINTPGIEYGSFVSYDGQYYFFSRPSAYGISGSGDIYWVSAGFIDSLKLTNFDPYVLNNIPDQSILLNEPYNYTIPDTTFEDDDGIETLSFMAKPENDAELPLWLTFDSIARTFTGTPEEAASINIKVLVTDTAGATAFDVFRLTAGNPNSIQQPEEITINIYPNPAKDHIRIITGVYEKIELPYTIVSMDGKILLKGKVLPDDPVNTSSLKKGIYMIRVLKNNTIFQKKILIE
ncbi:MAG: putative Ig domain-containing protein [Bacteroidales bacterium]|jgi:hypothetical protein